MKIAILVSMFPPKWIGGVEIATQKIANKLSGKGNDVNVITSLDKNLPRQDKEAGFCIQRVYYPRIKFFGVIFFWLRCLFLLKKNNPEIAHSQTIQMGLPCFLAKKIFGIPYIVYCHGSDVYCNWKFKKIISKLVLENAEAIIVVTDSMKNKIKEFGFNIKNIFTIPNGVELSEFENLSKPGMRKELKIDDSEKIALFVGTLKTVKGIRYLIEAIKIVKDKGLEIKLLLVGDGEQKEELERISEKLNLKENIIFVGRIDNNKIPKYMAVSDIFVLPSLSEGLPVVTLEAMASGLPIIATKVGGVPDILKDKENGFLIDSKDSEQIAERMLYLLSNKSIIESISFNNLKTAKNYSWDLIIKKLMEVYSLCLKK